MYLFVLHGRSQCHHLYYECERSSGRAGDGQMAAWRLLGRLPPLVSRELHLLSNQKQADLPVITWSRCEPHSKASAMGSHSLAVRAQCFDLNIVSARVPEATPAPRRTHALQMLKKKIYCLSYNLKNTDAQIRTCTLHGGEAFSLVTDHLTGMNHLIYVAVDDRDRKALRSGVRSHTETTSFA